MSASSEDSMLVWDVYDPKPHLPRWMRFLPHNQLEYEKLYAEVFKVAERARRSRPSAQFEDMEHAIYDPCDTVTWEDERQRCREIIRAEWIVQGIWENDWLQEPEWRWRHEWPLDEVLGPESESESELARLKRKVALFDARHQTRPLSQFLYQVDQERELLISEHNSRSGTEGGLFNRTVRTVAWWRCVQHAGRRHTLHQRWDRRPQNADFVYHGEHCPHGQTQNSNRNVESTISLGALLPEKPIPRPCEHTLSPLELEDISTQAYTTVKATWVRRHIWRDVWGVLPGMSWLHELDIKDIVREKLGDHKAERVPASIYELFRKPLPPPSLIDTYKRDRRQPLADRSLAGRTPDPKRMAALLAGELDEGEAEEDPLEKAEREKLWPDAIHYKIIREAWPFDARSFIPATQYGGKEGYYFHPHIAARLDAKIAASSDEAGPSNRRAPREVLMDIEKKAEREYITRRVAEMRQMYFTYTREFIEKFDSHGIEEYIPATQYGGPEDLFYSADTAAWMDARIASIFEKSFPPNLFPPTRQQHDDPAQAPRKVLTDIEKKAEREFIARRVARPMQAHFTHTRESIEKYDPCGIDKYIPATKYGGPEDLFYKADTTAIMDARIASFFEESFAPNLFPPRRQRDGREEAPVSFEKEAERDYLKCVAARLQPKRTREAIKETDFAYSAFIGISATDYGGPEGLFFTVNYNAFRDGTVASFLESYFSPDRQHDDPAQAPREPPSDGLDKIFGKGRQDLATSDDTQLSSPSSPPSPLLAPPLPRGRPAWQSSKRPAPVDEYEQQELDEEDPKKTRWQPNKRASKKQR